MSGNRNILQNNEITAVAAGQHKMYVVDTQDATQSPQGSGKYIDVRNLVLDKIGIDFIPINIYSNGQGDYIKANLRFAINDSDPAIVTTKSTVFTCTYSVGYTLYKALYAFRGGVGTYGVGGQTIALSDLNYIGREVIVDILDPDDLAEADNIQDSINESSNTFDTSIVNIFRRTIQGEVRVYAYTPENDYQEFIGFGQTPINEEDFTDITGNGNEESDNDITGFNFNTTTGDLTIETSQGGDFVVSLDGRYATAAQGALADTSVQLTGDQVITGNKIIRTNGIDLFTISRNGNLDGSSPYLDFINDSSGTRVRSTGELSFWYRDLNSTLSKIISIVESGVTIFSDITANSFTGALPISTTQGAGVTVTNESDGLKVDVPLANTALQQSDLEPYSKRVDTARKLSANPSGATLSILDENDNILDTISLGFLNNEGTTLVYNSTDETIEIRNDDDDLLSSIPVSSFVTNVGSNLNISGTQLQLRDDANAVLSTVTLGITNINGLQNALDGKATSAQGALADTAIQSIPTHTGDVTGDTELTIANSAVTGAKIAIATITGENIAQNAISGQKLEDDTIPGGKLVLNTVTNPRLSKMQGFTIKGNQLETIATPQDLTLSQVKSLLGLDSDYATAAQGELADNAIITGIQNVSQTSTVNADLDTMFTSLNYYSSQSINKPFDINSTVLTLRALGNFANQIAFPASTARSFSYRRQISGTWQDWKEIWDSGNLDPSDFATAAQGALADTALQSIPISSTQGSGVTVTNESDGLKVVVDSVDTSNLVKKTGETSQTITGNINGIGLLSATTFSGNVVATGTMAMPSAQAVPSSSTSSGQKGELRYDNDYLYVCINTNSWKRISLTTW